MATLTDDPPFRSSRYTTGAIILHWLTAILVLGQIASGYAMTELIATGSALQYDVFQLHKSLGITVLVLTVARITWRLCNPAPPEPASVSRLEARAAHVVHMAFYALLVLIPLIGWFIVTVSPVDIATVLFFVDRLPWPDLPGFSGLSLEARETLTEWGEEAHALLAYLTGALVLLHVAGALKHQLADGAFIGRMTGTARGDGPRESYGHATTVVTAFLFAALMIGAATYARAPEEETVASTVSPDQVAVLSSGAATEGAAQPSSDTAPTEDAAAAGDASDAADWTVDLDASTLGFTVTYGGKPLEGRFERFEPTIRFDPDALEATLIEVAIDTTSAVLDGTQVTASQLAGSDGFDDANFGSATFNAEGARADGEGGYRTDGVLTIRGQEAPQSLAFDVVIEGDEASATGTLTIDRFDYAIGQSNDAAAEWIAPDVVVAFDVLARRGAPAGADPVDVGQSAPETPEPGRWEVIGEDSVVDLAIQYDGSTMRGSIKDLDADIRFADDNLEASSIEVSLDLASADPAELHGAEALNVETNPTAGFVSDKITRVAPNAYIANGALTLNGTTQPVALPFELKVEDGVGTATGTVAIDRHAFGIGPEDEAVGPEVEVGVTVVARVLEAGEQSVEATR